MKLVIKNSEWLRGEMSYLFDSATNRYSVDSLLLKECGALGDLMDSYISLECFRNQEGYHVPKELIWLLDPVISSKIAVINDDPDTTDAEKIKLLKPIFAAHGVEIEWRESE